ncbi:MAG: Fe-S cluster assembly ATPase SufC [Candidatus Lloydbacteria bacterium RIFCSPHIGHO2_01_FULL_49_22]|uniref:Fe-S cluster assembly ATPase SufC n=1 Tax=Candidatus Lloydbacteria bacterium RIFCSPHIGHO2_01_FULL_49_22 TaxID=1798658 RepID=A0A1G2CTL1_9BACT|nr:MAG: Fe-S cluster assembly ATPase SufC [Candidatus Lloydbacteria bacterium RIFCSPHIGHO2_01_FULL_49_22]OGZ09122.1 MAG: Fe-S cluster assembly ATPase SufC [Candidatus Lloydbacteria bacterium RIFCSPHIGHO2_02_FULL_50_18]
MSELTINNVTVRTSDKIVVDGASLTIKSGEIHVLMGPNGSGKSSLLNAIMGHPKYEIRGGSVMLDGEDITTLATEKKARAGIFLSLQHLPEIAGVTLTNFLFRAHKSMKPESEVTPLEFFKLMEAKAKEFGIDPSYLRKHLNAGLSGGEKKQSEVLQLLALEPKFALLDEIDSGVDIDALKRVFAVISALRDRGMGFLLVTHYSKLLEHITPDAVTVIKEGRVVASGKGELVEKIAKEGFESLI